MIGVLLSTAAWAHDADVIYVQLFEAAEGQLAEAVTLTAGTLSQLAPIDADADGALSQSDLDQRRAAIIAGVWEQMPLEADAPCVRRDERAVLREGYVELEARFSCGPGMLAQDFKILRVLSTNYRVVLGLQSEGEGGRAFAQGNVQRLVIRPAAPPAPVRESGAVVGALWMFVRPEVTLIWVLSLLLASSVWAAAGRIGILIAGHSAVATAVVFLGLEPPELCGASVVAVVGIAIALGILVRGKETLVGLALTLLAMGDGLRAASGLTMNELVDFEVGRHRALLVLAVIAIPISRLIARRPELQRRASVVVACLALGGLGFSLVQTVRAF